MEFVEFVIDNCVRQNATTPEDYIGFTVACNYALDLKDTRLKPMHILVIGRMVNHDDHMNWRQVPATFANGNHGVRPEHVYRQIDILLAAKYDPTVRLTADEFYHRFEEIHPFTDGNGRVGTILYNTLFYPGSPWRNPPEMEW